MNVGRQAPLQDRGLDGPPARRLTPSPGSRLAWGAVVTGHRLRGRRRLRRHPAVRRIALAPPRVTSRGRHLSDRDAQTFVTARPRNDAPAIGGSRAQAPHQLRAARGDGRAHAGGDAPLRPRGHAAAGELRGAGARARTRSGRSPTPGSRSSTAACCDHAIKDLCRVYISRTVKCEFCGNQRSEKAIKAGLEEMQYDDLLNFEKSDRYDERQKAALSYAEAIAWGMPTPTKGFWARLHAHFSEPELVELGCCDRADLRPAELDPAARHRPPPVHGRHRRLDGARLPDRRGARREQGVPGLLGHRHLPLSPPRAALSAHERRPCGVLTRARLQVSYKRLHHRPGWGTSMTRTDLPELTVGWIGTGRMGAAMAARLGRAGVDLTVWNRTRGQGRAAGGRAAPRSPTTLAELPTATSSSRWCPRSADLEQVLLGDGGLLADPEHGAAASWSTARRSRPRRRRAMREACAERGRRLPRLAGQRQRQGRRGRQAEPGRAPVREEAYDRGRAAARTARPGTSPTSARARWPGW